MDSLREIGVSALMNIVSTFAFLLAFAFLKIQPANDRVYFSKWYALGHRESPGKTRARGVGRFVNLNACSYFTFLNWMPQALKMSASDLIEHAGLDSVVFLRIYILGYNVLACFLNCSVLMFESMLQFLFLNKMILDAGHVYDGSLVWDFR